ncbi:hypothetical protein [Zeaxanthinibacter enoshimensis]|uniref:hypothetical protein n=1 Tax=Zeaxanthinibacter enoshimensis TaxID=392009 RepID=UPI003563B845
MKKPGLKTVAGVILSCCLLLVLFQSCKEDKKEKEMEETVEEKENVIEVLTEVMDFQLQDTIQSGWQTFRYTNASKEPHLILIDKYPEGKTIADGKKEVMPPFQEGMDLINEGKNEEAMAAFGKLPPWFSEIVFTGGVGLLSPGEVSSSTVYLEPGYYVLECYVKMSNGVFHGVMGMVKELIVTNDSTDHMPPEADVRIELSSTTGMTVKDTISAGKQVFEVKFNDQVAYEHFLGHDVNLVKLSDTADISALEKWMNWADPEGLINPAPEGVTFLGGMNDLPAGEVGYFTADLDPGNYALISEVPQAGAKNLLYRFTIR